MYLKKVLNQPNLVGTVMIALLFSAGLVYAFAFDGFNVETVTGGEVEAWLAQAGDDNSGEEPDEEPCDCGFQSCPGGETCGMKTRNSKGKWIWPCGSKNNNFMWYPCKDSGCPRNHACTVMKNGVATKCPKNDPNNTGRPQRTKVCKSSGLTQTCTGKC